MKMIISIITCIFIMSSAYSNEETCELILENNYCLNIEWTEGPHIDGYSENSVTVRSLDTGSFEDLSEDLEFFTWMIMDGHEHGGAEVVTSRMAPGVIRNSEVYFFSGMDGIWQFKLRYNGNEYTLHELEI